MDSHRVLLILVFVLGVTNPTLGQTTDWTNELGRASLRGIGPIAVVVTVVSSRLEGDGLTVESIRTAAELRLRQLRIPVADARPLGKTPFLHVTVDGRSLGPRIAGGAFALTANLRQAVRVVATGFVLDGGTTWHAQFLGTDPEMGRGVREALTELVDRFSNDYLAANP